MQQRVPCVRALQFLDVELKHDVILAVATALCSGNIDAAHPNSDGDLKIHHYSLIRNEKTNTFLHIHRHIRRINLEKEN